MSVSFIPPKCFFIWAGWPRGAHTNRETTPVKNIPPVIDLHSLPWFLSPFLECRLVWEGGWGGGDVWQVLGESVSWVGAIVYVGMNKSPTVAGLFCSDASTVCSMHDTLRRVSTVKEDKVHLTMMWLNHTERDTMKCCWDQVLLFCMVLILDSKT